MKKYMHHLAEEAQEQAAQKHHEEKELLRSALQILQQRVSEEAGQRSPLSLFSARMREVDERSLQDVLSSDKCSPQCVGDFGARSKAT